MAGKKATKNRGRRAANDLMEGLRELAGAVADGAAMHQRFTVRTVTIPQPHEYSPASVKKLRDQLGMSQAVFADLLGVSRVWVQAWERGVRKPSALARRLMDTIRADPASWLAKIWAKAG
jgi:putative transcriptional regulator